MIECYRCDNRVVLDTAFIYRLKTAMAQLSSGLVDHAVKYKIDQYQMPVLAEVASVMRIIDTIPIGRRPAPITQ